MIGEKIYTWEGSSPAELKLYHIKTIKCGLTHWLGLTKSGEVYVWGPPDSGQLGMNYRVMSISGQHKMDKISNATKISCGSKHSVVLSVKCIYVWGNNFSG